MEGGGNCYNHYWENWQNFNADCVLDKSIVLMLNLLNLIIILILQENTLLGNIC